ncbi:XRE family transcriptional regulator [Ktedonosporobacter rubrisoli]|uniref:XRE family transcriptional regulator n=1 Tax=Ktedonosporobacter rubrisoli TaxID=2509675 RepID=A0A4P6JZ33_KTERU|nr:helix-turn-helix transcriptional regulator [Ktedonosporobacter rubrisoli]QBD80720.1 XRE family transcriptional regulator [Ktedonosporobacter rubrisoli]
MNKSIRRQELAQFLRTRRERLSPEVVGVALDTRRRTPGLRREELALLAGIGVSWYTRLEQGQDIVVSPQILERLAKVFDLNAAERHHLFVLAREHVPTEFYPLTSTISQELQGVLDSIATPAYVFNPRWDIMGWNRAINYVFPGFEGLSLLERNILRVMFGNPVYRTLYYDNEDYEQVAYKTVALFRACTDRYVQEPWFKDLIAELQQMSSAFQEWWAEHDVRATCTEPRALKHPSLGRMVFHTSIFQVVDAPDLQMLVFTAAEAETARKLSEPVE